MTEQDHKARVEAWLAEAGDEPMPFGKAVIALGQERGFPTLAEDACVLELEERHTIALIDHLDRIDNREHDDLALAVCKSIGLDVDSAEDKPDCLYIAMAWTYGEGLEALGRARERV